MAFHPVFLMRQQLVPDSRLITFRRDANRGYHVKLVFHEGIKARMLSDASEAGQEECLFLGLLFRHIGALRLRYAACISLRLVA